jgi:hypothetical protein
MAKQSEQTEANFLKGFENETLENVIHYWALMNPNSIKIDFLTVTENPAILAAINVIKQELNRG